MVDNGNASGRYGNLYIYIYIVIIYIYSNYIYIYIVIYIYIYIVIIYIWYFNGKFFDDMRKFTKKYISSYHILDGLSQHLVDSTGDSYFIFPIQYVKHM